jgi:hypothetical protein
MLEGLPFGHGVDCWALEIMVFEMLTGSPPYNYNTEDDRKGGDDDDDGGVGGDDDDKKELGAEIKDDGKEEECDGGGGGDDDNDGDEEDVKLFNKIMNTEVDFPDDLSLAAISLVSKVSVITIKSEALNCIEIEIM